jgi:SAM-dependent methyltransferase
MLRKITKLPHLLKYPSNIGYCSICEKATFFVRYGNWLRDNYKCIRCNSIPRNRALVRSIKLFAPNFENLLVHESSPGNTLSYYLQRRCKNYTCSQYFPAIQPGKECSGFRCENFESLTFEDCAFDLFITSDVFEHVMHPDKAFHEIARVLKPGGMHIFTIPWYPELEVTRQRAQMVNGKIKYIEEPVYHGNPVDEKGALVTFDWGLDFIDFIYAHSKMSTIIHSEINRSLGLEAKFLEVFISRKTYAQS